MYGTIKVDASRLRPLVNTVLVKLTKITKAGGILLPDMVKDRDRLYHEWGEVVALGSAAYEEWGGSDVQDIRPGDKVLFAVAQMLRKHLRSTDFVARIGGEEFIIFLPDTSQVAALALSERLHQAIRQSVVAYEQSSIRYSASIGLVSVLPSADVSLEEILKRADQLLYIAKRQGRACTVSSNG